MAFIFIFYVYKYPLSDRTCFALLCVPHCTTTTLQQRIASGRVGSMQHAACSMVSITWCVCLCRSNLLLLLLLLLLLSRACLHVSMPQCESRPISTKYIVSSDSCTLTTLFFLSLKCCLFRYTTCFNHGPERRGRAAPEANGAAGFDPQGVVG